MFEKTSKYLGVPSDQGVSMEDMFACKLGRMNAKSERWKQKLMSKAGKEILIKIVVKALPQYAMSMLKFGLYL